MYPTYNGLLITVLHVILNANNVRTHLQKKSYVQDNL